MHAERAADPDRVDQVVAFGVGGAGVDEDAEASVVQHQPGDQRGEDFGGEGDLVHGLLVGGAVTIITLATQPCHLLL